MKFKNLKFNKFIKFLKIRKNLKIEGKILKTQTNEEEGKKEAE